jgi:TRAP-type C4-dicarboxylate transport system substrate-binding protein
MRFAARTGVAGASVVLVVAMAGCTPIHKPTPAPLVLQMAHVDGEAALDPAASWFADELDRVSGGAMKIARRVSCCGVDQSAQEQELVGRVADGTYHLGWVGVRVFSTLGDDDFVALTLPFVEDSYATQRATATSRVPHEVFAGLGRLGVTGLALMPGYLRKPLSTTHALRGPADWSGALVFHYRGGTNRETLTALGAVPVEGGPADMRDDGLLSRTIEATEQSLVYAAADTARVRYVTVNVNLWPRMSALIVNPDVRAQLTKQQRGWLDAAIADTIRIGSSRLAQRDHAFARYECAHGVAVVAASPDELAGLHAAVQPVIDDATRHPLTARLLRQLQALRTPDPESVRAEAC